MSPPVGVAQSAQGGGVAADALQTEILSHSPYKYVQQGEDSGTNAEDIGSAALDGTYINTPTLGQTGVPGGDGRTAVTYARASSERVDFAFDANLDGLDAMTMGIFFKTSTTGTAMTLLGNWGGSIGDRIWLLHITAANALTFFLYAGGAVPATGGNCADGAFHSAICTWDKNGADQKSRLYVDGSQVAISASGINGMQTSPAGSVAHIGANGETGSEANHFDGTMQDFFFIRNTALTAGQVSDIHTAAAIV